MKQLYPKVEYAKIFNQFERGYEDDFWDEIENEFENRFLNSENFLFFPFGEKPFPTSWNRQKA
jgi:hypothetical protein